MKCKDYIFELTSGRLEEGGWWLQTQARTHRLLCVRCRAFTHNDQALRDALKARSTQLQDDLQPMDRNA